MCRFSWSPPKNVKKESQLECFLHKLFPLLLSGLTPGRSESPHFSENERTLVSVGCSRLYCCLQSWFEEICVLRWVTGIQELSCSARAWSKEVL